MRTRHWFFSLILTMIVACPSLTAHHQVKVKSGKPQTLLSSFQAPVGQPSLAEEEEKEQEESKKISVRISHTSVDSFASREYNIECCRAAFSGQVSAVPFFLLHRSIVI
jgi:hypothetical protein